MHGGSGAPFAGRVLLLAACSAYDLDVGTPRAGASVLLLLAVGPLLLFAPWWPLPALVLAPLSVLGLVYAAFVFAIGYKWLASRRERRTEMPTPCQEVTQWQAGHWDVEPQHVYLANIGDSFAYEVIVTQGDEVICTAEAVPPFSAERMSSAAGLPWYLNLSARQRLQSSPAVTTRGVRTGSVGSGSAMGDVRVRWRTQSGVWRTQTAAID